LSFSFIRRAESGRVIPP